jgi:large subunit ribosomal protein L22
MGARKRNSANELKEAKKQQYFAVLKNCPTSPRKMRLGSRYGSRNGSEPSS